MKDYSVNIADAIKSILDEVVRGNVILSSVVKYISFDEKTGEFYLLHQATGEIRWIIILIDVDKDSFSVRIYYPLSLFSGSKEIDNQVEMYVKSANEKLCRLGEGEGKSGSFEFHPMDKALSYVYTKQCGGMEPSWDMVINSIRESVKNFERYAPRFMDIVYKGHTAATAMETCEMEEEQEWRKRLLIFGNSQLIP